MNTTATTLNEFIKEGVELGHDAEALKAYVDIFHIDYADMDDFEERYCGKWESDEDFVQDLLETTGDIPESLPNYIHIDWEGTARDIMMDYATDNDHYFRSC